MTNKQLQTEKNLQSNAVYGKMDIGETAIKNAGVKVPIKPVPTKDKPDNVKRFELLGDEKALLYARKNADYGNSFDKSLDEDGLTVAKIRLGDKYRRFCHLIKNPVQVTEEKLRETLIDLSNYADMTIMWMDNKEEQEAIKKMKDFYTPVRAVNHNDEMDAATYSTSGDEVVKEIHGMKNTYDIHVHADNKTDTEKVAQGIFDQIKRLENNV